MHPVAIVGLEKEVRMAIKSRVRAKQRFALLTVGALFSAVLAALLLSLPVPAYAADLPARANVANSEFWFDLSFNGSDDTAAAAKRAKENDTTVFFWPQKMGSVDYCFLYAWGDVNVYGYGNANCTYNNYAVTAGTIPGSIRTSLYENGYRRMWIEAWQASNPGQIYGYWSPDSTTTYTVLNVGY